SLGEHTCKPFQQFWNETSEADWVFEVIEVCEQSQLKEVEHRWALRRAKWLLNGHVGRFGYEREFSPAVRAKLSRLAIIRHQAGKFGQATWSQKTKQRCARNWHDDVC